MTSYKDYTSNNDYKIKIILFLSFFGIILVVDVIENICVHPINKYNLTQLLLIILKACFGTFKYFEQPGMY